MKRKKEISHINFKFFYIKNRVQMLRERMPTHNPHNDPNYPKKNIFFFTLYYLLDGQSQ